jgi:hypothetical protein
LSPPQCINIDRYYICSDIAREVLLAWICQKGSQSNSSWTATDVAAIVNKKSRKNAQVGARSTAQVPVDTNVERVPSGHSDKVVGSGSDKIAPVGRTADELGQDSIAQWMAKAI